MPSAYIASADASLLGTSRVRNTFMAVPAWALDSKAGASTASEAAMSSNGACRAWAEPCKLNRPSRSSLTVVLLAFAALVSASVLLDRNATFSSVVAAELVQPARNLAEVWAASASVYARSCRELQRLAQAAASHDRRVDAATYHLDRGLLHLRRAHRQLATERDKQVIKLFQPGRVDLCRRPPGS